MSTNTAVEASDTRQRTTCMMCAMEFVAHKEWEHPPAVPEMVCCWCFYRGGGALYRRFIMLYEGLKVLSDMHVVEERGCVCQGCQTLKAAQAVLR